MGGGDVASSYRIPCDSGLPRSPAAPSALEDHWHFGVNMPWIIVALPLISPVALSTSLHQPACPY